MQSLTEWAAVFPVLQSEEGSAERGLQGETWGPLGKIRNRVTKVGHHGNGLAPQQAKYGARSQTG